MLLFMCLDDRRIYCLKKYIIGRIIEKIAGLELKVKELDILIHSGSTIPTYYIDDLLIES